MHLCATVHITIVIFICTSVEIKTDKNAIICLICVFQARAKWSDEL